MIFISTTEKAWVGAKINEIMMKIICFKKPRSWPKILTVYDGAPGQRNASTRLMLRKSGREGLILAGGTSERQQPNDKEINLIFQTQMRKRVREHVLNTRKADHVAGIDHEVPNLTVRQLIDFSADSLRCVSTEKCINSFEKCGFAAESDKWSTFIRDAVENPPSIDDLPEEYQSAYDHTGLESVPKRKSKKGKIYAYPFVCSYCNTEYTSKYSDSAKLHMAAEFGCPVKSLMKSWKPTPYRKALFFDQNFF